MKERTVLKAAKLIAVTMAMLVILLSIVSCSFMNFIISGGSYSISFDGVEIPMENVSVKPGEVPIIPSVPEKAGYTGVWTLDGKTFDATAVYEYGKDITLFASYTPIDYKVTFKADGVQVGNVITYNVENTTITAPEVPEKPGYNGEWESYSLTMGDVTVNAVYIANGDTKYTVEHYIENDVGEYELYSSEKLAGKTGTTATANAITIEKYVAQEEVGFGQIVGDGSLVIKLYYDIIRFEVTFDYNSSRENTVVSVKYGEAVSEDAATLDSRIPYAFLGWMKDGEVYDFSTPVTDNITVTAAYENEYVFEDAEGELTWIANKSSMTVSPITGNGVISGNQSMKVIVDGTYRGIYKMNLDTIDFSNVNYIYMKVRADAPVRLSVRFINTNDPYGTYVPYSTDVAVDGKWQTICIDMDALFVEKEFSKEQIKTIFILSDKPATLTIDDIVFVNDKSLYKQDIIAHYDFETVGGWSSTGTGNTYAYITKGGINGQSLQANVSAWNGLFNNKVAGLFTDVNYIYLKIKGVSSNPYIRLYSTAWITDNYYNVLGTTVETKNDYRIVRYDISDLSLVEAKGSADFDKSAISAIFIGSLSSAATFVVDDLIFASVEISFPPEVVFKADGVTVGTVSFTVGDESVIAPAVPEKAGYTGVWESYILENSDVVVNAIYTPITYTATFVADGVTVGTVNFTVADKTIAAPAVPKKEGLNGAWESYTIIADNITINAVYSDKKAEYTVTFDYGGVQESTTVKVEDGATVSADAALLDSKYPFAFVEWQRDGVKFDFATAITENITLTAVYANEFVYDDFETEGTWNKTASATYTHITAGAINGQSLQVTTTGNYQAINRQNLTDKIDFTDVNYIFVKVRASSNVRITFRFVNTNDFAGTQIQAGYDLKADGGWHTICIDMNSLFTDSAVFGKDAIKSFVIMMGTPATVAIDDIVFVNDKSLYKQDVIKHYDFENQGSWSATGSGNTATYITEGAINNQSLQATVTAWNGLVNQNAAGLFADTNYVYLKIKGVSANPYIRLYKSVGISNDFYQLEGKTVVARNDYRIVKFDISDWSKLTVRGAANFTKSEVKTLFFGSFATAATFVIDDVILSASELSFE